MMWFAGFALLFLVSVALVGLQTRDRARALRSAPAYRYLWFVGIGLRTAVILLVIMSGRYYALSLLMLIYLALLVVVGLPLTTSILVRLYYCPRVESRGGNIAFRIVSLVPAVIIAFTIHQVWETSQDEIRRMNRY